MIAGSIGLLEDTVDEPLDSYHSGGFATLDVQETQQYLDDSQVQHGRACDLVESRDEDIFVDNGTIYVERVASQERVWTEWVADVTDAGFVAAERTSGSNPPFPFGVFMARTGQRVEEAEIDTGAFLDAQRDADDLIDLWFVGQDSEGRDSVSMDYHTAARLAPGDVPNIGVGFETAWGGTTARGIIYASGYVAIFTDGWGPIRFASFLRDEVLPHAYVPEENDAKSEQTTLEETDDDEPEYVKGVCGQCGYERSKTTVDEHGRRVCILCEEGIAKEVAHG